MCVCVLVCVRVRVCACVCGLSRSLLSHVIGARQRRKEALLVSGGGDGGGGGGGGGEGTLTQPAAAATPSEEQSSSSLNPQTSASPDPNRERCYAMLRSFLLSLLVRISRYKILFYFKAFVHESSILLSPPPTCTARTIAILLHAYCAIYDAPPATLVYARQQHTILAITISCNGPGARAPAQRRALRLGHLAAALGAAPLRP